MKELDNKIFSECLKEVGRRDSEGEYLDYLKDRAFPCKNKKWEELGLVERYRNWQVNR